MRAAATRDRGRGLLGFAEIGQTSSAQACVFQNSVPHRSPRVSRRPIERYFAPNGSSGTKYDFQSIDGSHHVGITVTKESDGQYWITGVERT